MHDLPHDVERALSNVYALPCRAISISSYGALQLGFGEATSYFLAGKYSKKRFEIELGTYTSAWDCTNSRGLSRPLDEQAIASALLGRTVVSIHVTACCVVLATDSGQTIVIDGRETSEDIFYAHLGGDVSVVFNPESGWSVEGTC